MASSPRSEQEYDPFPSDIGSDSEVDYVVQEEEHKHGVVVDQSNEEDSEQREDPFPSDDERSENSSEHEQSVTGTEDGNEKKIHNIVSLLESGHEQGYDPFPSESEGGSSEDEG